MFKFTAMRKRKIRFVLMVVVGVIISFLLNAMNLGVQVEHNRFMDFFTAIVITIIVWEGNLRIDTLLNSYFPWEKEPGKRILVHLPIGIIFSAFIIYLSMQAFNKYVCEMPQHMKDGFMVTAIIIGTLFSIILLSVEIGAQFFGNWKKTLVEVEKYKAESLQAQLQNLKDQLNPHFLFNNLSVLSSLVYKDQDKAVDFINQLSKVYRYLLDTGNKELVSLADELNVLKSYTYLLQIRFDKNLVFVMEIPPGNDGLMIPAMAVQMLVENAIKHNEISSDYPLTISIKIRDGYLVVKNNLQLRSNEEPSTGKGLKNIKHRYSYFTDQEVKISDLNNEFSVSIPLLKIK